MADVAPKTVLAGNPNTGKSALFNALTGMNQYVGNWSGVTVERKIGKIKRGNGEEIEISDSPGLYGLSAASAEEREALDVIFHGGADFITQVVDSSNPERGFYLSLLLKEAGFKVLLAMNMLDEAQARGISLNAAEIKKTFGCDAVFCSATKEIGLNELKDALFNAAKDDKGVETAALVDYGETVEAAIAELVKSLDLNSKGLRPPARFIAMETLCENDYFINSIFVKGSREADEAKRAASHIRAKAEVELGEDFNELLAKRRYDYVEAALAKIETRSETSGENNLTAKIDAVVLNKYLGVPIFGALMFIIFQASFRLAEYPMEWIQTGVSAVAELVKANVHNQFWAGLTADGAIAGVGFLLVFLPSIVILFFFISILEDSGYMARAAFIADPFMRLLRLHGKSVIPLIVGFGCNVPAIMNARILESRRDRVVTALIIPYMSCSGRFPIYLMFSAAFFTGTVFGLSQAAIATSAVYLIGVIVGLAMGRFVSSVFFKEKSEPFVLELPPYRFPAPKLLLKHVFDRSFEFVKRMGTVIAGASIAVWALANFPAPSEAELKRIEAEKTKARSEFAQALIPEFLKSGLTPSNPFNNPRFKKMYDSIKGVKECDDARADGKSPAPECARYAALSDRELFSRDGYAYNLVSLYIKEENSLKENINQIDRAAQTRKIERSFLGIMGKAVAPIFEPLGFTWKETVALLSGVAAKEIVVSTYGVIFKAGSAEADDPSLIEGLNKTGLGKAGAFAFMVFSLLYMPCVGALAAIRRETRGYFWPAFSVAAGLVVAYAAAMLSRLAFAAF